MKVLEMPSNSKVIQLKGIVLDSLSNTKFRVELPNGNRISATLSGEMRLNIISILPGDKVLLEMSPYDLTQGSIVAKEEE